MRLNQRLVGLHTRSGRFAEAAVCCRNLENVYREAGYPEEASRYGELAGRYEERSGAARPTQAVFLENQQQASIPEIDIKEEPVVHAAVPEIEVSAPEPVAEMEVAAEVAPVAPVPVAPAKSGLVGMLQFQRLLRRPLLLRCNRLSLMCRRLNLSQPKKLIFLMSGKLKLWTSPLSRATPEETVEVAATEEFVAEAATVAEVAPVVDNTQAIAEIIEEIRFYLASGMADQANGSITKLEQLNADEATIAAMRQEIEAATVVAAAPRWKWLINSSLRKSLQLWKRFRLHRLRNQLLRRRQLRHLHLRKWRLLLLLLPHNLRRLFKLRQLRLRLLLFRPNRKRPLLLPNLPLRQRRLWVY